MLTSRRVQRVPPGMPESGVPERDLEIAEIGGIVWQKNNQSTPPPRLDGSSQCFKGWKEFGFSFEVCRPKKQKGAKVNRLRFSSSDIEKGSHVAELRQDWPPFLFTSACQGSAGTYRIIKKCVFCHIDEKQNISQRWRGI
jgi:hypothetical protein